MTFHKQPTHPEKIPVDYEAPPGCFGVRHIQVLLLFSCMVLAYGMRVNLSVGIVAMTDKRTSPNPNVPTYDWDNASVILSAFFWGYVLPQAGVGLLAKRFGPKWFLVGAMALCSVFSLLVPVTASTLGSTGLMVNRAIQGFGQGFFFACIHTMLSKWAPLPERSRITTFVYTGGPFGTVLSMPLTGYLSASWAGWPIVFYIYGSLGLCWVLLFALLAANSPAVHKSVSIEERNYIEKSLGHHENMRQEPTPWPQIWKSLPYWAIMTAQFGQNWGFWTLLTEIPTYMNKIMFFDISSNGLLSSAPYFTLWILGFVFSPIADKMISKGVSVGATRKTMNSIGKITPAIALVCLGFIDPTERGLAIALLIIAVGFNSATYCGFNVSHIDISPNHAGTLMGIANSIGNVSSILAPLCVQYIVTDEYDVTQWRTVFLIAAGVYVLANTIFVVFGSGEVQKWNSSVGNADGDQMKNAVDETTKV